MFKIGIGLSFYQDFESLRRMLQSLQSYPIDLLIAIDGRYQEYRGEQDLSDTAVRDLFKGFQTPYYYRPWPNTSQIEKRQQYFDLADDLDIVIVMDSDEFIVHDKTNWALFIEDLEHKIETNQNNPKRIQSYCIPVRGYNIQGDSTKTDSELSPTANVLRAFYRPYELEYYGNHYTIRNKHTQLVQSYHAGWITCSNILIGHDHALRSPEYLEQNDKYQKLQTQYEREGRYLKQHDNRAES